MGGSALFRTPLPFVSSQAVSKMADQEKNDVNETFPFSIRPGGSKAEARNEMGLLPHAHAGASLLGSS